APEKMAKQHPHGARVRTCSENAGLGATKLCRGNHLHRLGNLLRFLDAADPVTYFSERCHRSTSRRGFYSLERIGELLENGFQFRCQLFREYFLLGNLAEDVRVLELHHLKEL